MLYRGSTTQKIKIYNQNNQYKNDTTSCTASTTQKKNKSKSGGFTDISQIVYLHSLRLSSQTRAFDLHRNYVETTR